MNFCVHIIEAETAIRILFSRGGKFRGRKISRNSIRSGYYFRGRKISRKIQIREYSEHSSTRKICVIQYCRYIGPTIHAVTVLTTFITKPGSKITALRIVSSSLSTSVRLFADDCILYTPIRTQNDSSLTAERST